MKYLNKPSQEQQILDLLTEKGTVGVYIWEITDNAPRGLGIKQYNARIFGLRKKGWNIINKEPGHFVLHTDGQLPVYLKPQASNQIVQPSTEPEYPDKSNLVPVTKTITILGQKREVVSWEEKGQVMV